jgi:hypothetical protein
MIETIARAIAKDQDQTTDEYWEAYVGAAEAAIEALRNPPPTVIALLARLPFDYKDRPIKDHWRLIVNALCGAN